VAWNPTRQSEGIVAAHPSSPLEVASLHREQLFFQTDLPHTRSPAKCNQHRAGFVSPSARHSLRSGSPPIARFAGGMNDMFFLTS